MKDRSSIVATRVVIEGSAGNGIGLMVASMIHSTNDVILREPQRPKDLASIVRPDARKTPDPSVAEAPSG